MKLLELLKAGIPVPQAFDAQTGEKSFRLFTASVSFALAALSIVALHFFDHIFAATWTAIAFFSICMVFYMLKKLTKAKIDLDDKSLEFADESDNKQE